jgi:hypothetical protein
MIALITISQKNLLLGKKYDGVQYFNPVSDFYGHWFISQEEIENTTNNEFLWVKDLALTGKASFTPTDLYSIVFDELNQVLTLNRFNGTHKSINYVDLPNQTDFNNLKAYIELNYDTYNSIYYQRKDNICNIEDGLNIKKLVVNAMPAEGYNLFNIVGLICVNLTNQ